MSVLNKMLKDLEQRQGQVSQHAGIPSGVQVLGQVPRSRLTSMLLLAAIGLMLVATTLVAWWMMNQRTAAPPARGTLAAASAQTAPPVPMTAVANVVSASAVQGTVAPASAAPPALVTASAAQAPLAASPPRAATLPTPVRISAGAATIPPPAPVAPAAREPGTIPTAPVPRAAAPAPAAPELAAVKQVSPTQNAEYQYQRALACVQQENVAEALPLLRSALQIAPRHQAARQLLVGLLINQGKNTEASDLLREGQLQTPTDLDMAMTLARLQLDNGAVNAAIDTLQVSLPHAGGNGAYLAFKASLHQKQKEHAAAAALLTHALQLEPGTGKWLLALAVSQQALGQEQAARSSAEAAMASGNLPRELQSMARQLAP